MKNTFVRVTALTLSLLFMLSIFAGCAKPGEQGPVGPQGEAGLDGKSAYDLAVANGYTGTVEEWLSSLIGDQGAAGKDGANGQDGKDGKDGANGKDGKDGSDGKSAYELAVEKGYTGTAEEWLASLVGEKGEKGDKGATGNRGAAGDDGADGRDGKSAYELAVDKGYTGTEEEWLASLVGAKGERGEQGIQGERGEQGIQGERGEQGIQGERGEQGIQGERGEQGIQGEAGTPGVGISSAHIDENMHLILEMTDGTTIDAGYVGVEVDDSEPEIYMTRAEWINALVEALAYAEITLPEAPSFSDISDNEYQQAIEQAVKYDLLDMSSDTFMPNETATREFAMVTAIKAMGYIPSKDIECVDIDDILHPEYAQLALELELVELTNGKFQPEKPLEESEKELIFSVLEDTLNSMSGPDGDEEGFVYNQNVVSLSSFTGFSVTNTNPLIQYTEDGKLKLPRMPELENLTVNQIIAIDNKHAFKVVSSVIEGEWVLIEYTTPEIHEILDRLDIAGTAYPDVDNFQPAEGVTIISNSVQTFASGGGGIDLPQNNSLVKELEITMANGHKVKIIVDWTVTSAEYKYDIDFRGIFPDVHNAYIAFDNDIDISISYGTDHAFLDNCNDGKFVLGLLPFIGTDNFGIVAQVSLVLNAEGSFEFSFEVVGTTGAQIVNNLPRTISTWDVNMNDFGFGAELKAGAKVEVLAEIFKWDLISFAVDFGLSAKGEAKLRSGPMICFDCSFAPYLEFTLFENCLIDDWLKCSTKIVILANNGDNPWQYTGIHMEGLFTIVEECTYTEEGTIVGIVVNADNPYMMIANAKIEVYDYISGLLVKDPVFSDLEGEYSVNTDDGTYKIRVSANGYIPFETVQEIREGETVYVEALLMVAGTEDSETRTSAGGTITDAITGYPLENVTLTIRKGWNKTTGTAYDSLITNENGRYEITLPLGNYTVHMKKEGYVSSHFNIAVTQTPNWNLSGSIVPTGDAEFATGNLTVVLNWGEHPRDLDSHLFAPTSDGENLYHVYFSNKNHYENNSIVANLDVDDTTSYGPETITVYSMNETGTYSYFVHDYTNRSNASSTAMAASGAYVKVYIGERLIATYYVPAMKAGTTWHVFDFDAELGKITAVNSVSGGYPEYTASGISLFGNYEVQLPEKAE